MPKKRDIEDEIDVGPLEPSQIRSMAKDCIDQLRNFGKELAKTENDMDADTVEFLLDALKDEFGV